VTTAALGTSRARAATIVEGSPGLVPCGIAVAVLLWLAGDEGGFRGTTWMPTLLLLLAVLFVCLVALPRPQPSRAALLAVLLLTAYGAWALLSLLWAGQEELAWDAGNRTLLYAVILALCTLWPLRGDAAAILLGAYGLGVAAIALVELLKVPGAAQSVQYFHEARLAEPVGYANANVALWMLGMLPCAILAGRRGVPAPLRGLFLGAACLLLGAALLGQSRGWLIALPVTVVIAIVVVPGRGRTIVSLAAVGAGLLLALDPLLDVYRDWHPLQPTGDTYDTALRMLLIASAALVVLGTGAALLDRRVELPGGTARRISAGVVAAMVVMACVGVAGYAVVERSPIAAVSDHWNEFKQGGAGPERVSSRFSGSSSTYRFDYWRIAWREFERAPLLGAGADNFGRAYQKEGESPQTPRYPHSTPLVALAETGLIGALLMFGAFAAAVVAALPALRRRDLTGVAAGMGVLMFAYWLVHGSLDWFWEFPGLSGPAMLGLGVAMASARGLREEPAGAAAQVPRSVLAVVAACALLVAASVVPPWLAEREQRRGTKIAAQNPEAAFDHLDRAASLNPLSPVPDKAAGIIELRRQRYEQAERRLRAAMERDPGDSGLYLMLGVLASHDGRQREAVRLIRKASRMAPLDEVAYESLEMAEYGDRLDPLELDRAIQEDVAARIGPE
jgi:tetratricopeptide (TPR) repeat protein